jgi:hypothetical protein
MYRCSTGLAFEITGAIVVSAGEVAATGTEESWVDNEVEVGLAESLLLFLAPCLELRRGTNVKRGLLLRISSKISFFMSGLIGP